MDLLAIDAYVKAILTHFQLTISQLSQHIPSLRARYINSPN